MSDGALTVRVMADDERASVLAVARRAFSRFDAAFVTTKGHTLVAVTEDDQVIGGAVLRALDLGERRIGVVDWIFADPGAAVPGTGSALRDAALTWFDETGCDEQVARIEPVNTASQELHRRAGFEPLPVRSQFRRWGWRTPELWIRSHAWHDVGLRMWARPAERVGPRLVSRWVGTLLLNLLLLVLVTLRSPRELTLDPVGLGQLGLIAVALLGLREGVLRAVARMRGVRLGHVPWVSALGLAAPLALAFGVWLPLTGSSVPDEPGWRYDRELPRFAPAHLIAGLVVAAVAWAAVLTTGAPDWVPLADLQRAAVMLALLDLVVPVPPIVGSSARIVFDRSRPLWAVLAVLGAGPLVVTIVGAG